MKQTINSVIRKWNIVYDQSNKNYDVGNETIYNTVLKSSLCDYNNACISVRGDILSQQLLKLRYRPKIVTIY